IVCSQCVRTYRPKSCIIQIHGITTPHPIRSTTCVFKNLSIEILNLRVFVSQMATHVAPWEDEEGWTHSNCPNGYNFPNMLCELSRYLGYPQCPEYIAKVVTENEEKCIKCTFICHHTQTEPIFCKRPSLHSKKPTRQPHLKLLLSYVKGTQVTWILLQPHTCPSTIRQMDIGEFNISGC